MIVIVFATEKFNGSSQSPMSSPQNDGDSLFLSGDQIVTSYCKTSCSSPCSSYPSEYGELCCEWSQSPSGNKICALSMSDKGVCTCGIASKMTTAAGIYMKPLPNASPSPASSQGDSPTPGLMGAAYPYSNNQNLYHPNPTIQWNWNPYPTMSWLPFNPITAPENGTPCKRMCRRPCGWMQLNGESFCCETSFSGGCDMAQINGQCYCG